MTVFFDVRTLLFTGAAASFICATMLFLVRKLHRPSRIAVTWAAVTEFAFALAMLLLSLRGLVPDVLSYTVANTLGQVGALLTLATARQIAGLRVRISTLAAASAVLLLIQVTLPNTPDTQTVRLVLTSLLQGGCMALCIPVLMPRLHIDPAEPVRWAIGVSTVFAGAHLFRIPYTLVTGVVVSPAGMVEHNLGHVAMTALFALAPMVYAMVIIGLVNGRTAQELRALATTDALTGVRTRRSFIEDAQQAMLISRLQGQDTALLMLDLDRFKQVNDRFGHASGDRVLVQFAQLLGKGAPRGAVIGRYGGEEFCVLLAQSGAGDAHRLAQHLCDATRDADFDLDGAAEPVTVSIGVATGQDGQSLPELLLAADRRLYLAKARGRDRVVSSDRPASADATADKPNDHELIPV